MHIEFTFLHKDRETFERCFDSLQLGGLIPTEDEYYVLPDDEHHTLYVVDRVIRVLPLGEHIFHIHVICMEVVEEDESWEKNLFHPEDN